MSEHKILNSADYVRVAQSADFKKLNSDKKKFAVPYILAFLAFYFALPYLTATSTCLNAPAIGPISWAWIYAFAQFIMTWTFCAIYVRKAREFDERGRVLRQQILEGKI
jgi:uncharacterized membrane protein (DUF485 family)